MIRSTLLMLVIWALSGPATFANNICLEFSSPQVVAPADVVVSCSYWFSLGMLDDPTNPTFGRFVYGQQNIQKFKTIDRVCPSWCEYDSHTGYDPDIDTEGKACEHYRRYYRTAHPDDRYPLVWGWDGYVNGATSAVEISIDDRRHCGTGLIIRTFSIFDRGLRYSDEQRIWIIDCNPFYVSDDCFDPDDDIEWPLHCQQPDPLDGCYADLSPDNPSLGRPRIRTGADDQCNLIAIDFKDDTITVEEGACLKLIRTWTVVDWCKYHPLKNPGEGRYEYIQVIKVRDKLDPEIECYIGDCTPAVLNPSTNVCEAYIELRAEGVDSCTVQDHLRYEYKIDLYDDGQGPLGGFDLRVGPLTKLEDAPVILENPYAEHPDSVLNASGTYPIGVHRLKWFVEDGCSNVALCDTTFEIKDCKAPTPYCKTGIITVVMPSTGTIDVWASDLNDDSFDNCTDKQDLIFSFSSDTSFTSMTFDCDSIGIHDVEIWVTDEEGNQDYCTTKIEIQDSQNNCPNNIITGTVTSSPHGAVQFNQIEARLYQNGQFLKNVSVVNGQFDLNIPTNSGVYELMIFSNDAPLNGLSVADVLVLKQHLLGDTPFTDYMQNIAADANGDCRLSVGDITAILKVLTGRISDFTSYNVNSYLFLPISDPSFDASNFCAAEGRYLIDMSQPLLNSYDFTPVKIGDIQN